MKAWFATAAAPRLLVQLFTASWMWGRLPGVRRAPGWIAALHRWSGAFAFVAHPPPAVHCLWALGFPRRWARACSSTGSRAARFYGAYAAKMLGLRSAGFPGWALPVLGGPVLALLTTVWLTSALWFFTRSGVPLT